MCARAWCIARRCYRAGNRLSARSRRSDTTLWKIPARTRPLEPSPRSPPRTARGSDPPRSPPPDAAGPMRQVRRRRCRIPARQPGYLPGRDPASRPIRPRRPPSTTSSPRAARTAPPWTTARSPPSPRRRSRRTSIRGRTRSRTRRRRRSPQRSPSPRRRPPPPPPPLTRTATGASLNSTSIPDNTSTPPAATTRAEANPAGASGGRHSTSCPPFVPRTAREASSSPTDATAPKTHRAAPSSSHRASAANDGVDAPVVRYTRVVASLTSPSIVLLALAVDPDPAEDVLAGNNAGIPTPDPPASTTVTKTSPALDDTGPATGTFKRGAAAGVTQLSDPDDSLCAVIGPTEPTRHTTASAEGGNARPPMANRLPPAAAATDGDAANVASDDGHALSACPSVDHPSACVPKLHRERAGIPRGSRALRRNRGRLANREHRRHHDRVDTRRVRARGDKETHRRVIPRVRTRRSRREGRIHRPRPGTRRGTGPRGVRCVGTPASAQTRTRSNLNSTVRNVLPTPPQPRNPRRAADPRRT